MQRWIWFPDGSESALDGFSAVAAQHGYTIKRGVNAGSGNPAALIAAIAGGEVATVMLDDEQFAVAIEALRREAKQTNMFWRPDEGIALFAIVDALEAARERREEEKLRLALLGGQGKEQEKKC